MKGTPTTESPTVPKGLHSYPLQGKRKANPVRMAVDNTIKAMIEQGSSVRKIATALNISASTVQRVRNDMKALTPGEDLKTNLLSSARDTRTGLLIDHFIDKGLKLRKVRGSDAIAAAKLYADRRWPTRSEAPPPAELFVHVDLSIFKPDPLDNAKDVTPTTICSVEGEGKNEEGEIINEINNL